MDPILEQSNSLLFSPSDISVLIVDDIPETRRILRILLDDPRIRIVGEAGDGNEALHQFHKLLPDVVVMGLHMPGGDGIQITGIMRILEPDANIIILSVESGHEYIRRAMLAGARDYFAKPPDPDKLLKCVIKLGSKKRGDSSTK